MGADYSYPSTSTVQTKRIPINVKHSTESLSSSCNSHTMLNETSVSRGDVTIILLI